MSKASEPIKTKGPSAMFEFASHKMATEESDAADAIVTDNSSGIGKFTGFLFQFMLEK